MNKNRVSPPPGNSAIPVAFNRPSFLPPVLLWSLVVLLACGSQVCPRLAAAGDEDPFKINIRTAVDRPYTMFSKKPFKEHSKLYSLAWIRQAKSTGPSFVEPVDEVELLQHLHDVLTARGFHEPASGKVPDIVLTVIYGRSRLRNPYEDKTLDIGDSQGMDNTVIGDAELLTKERTPGRHEKSVAAGEEKIFIAVTAWEFPGFSPTDKPKQLWRTIINVDDPDQDLNLVAGKMLAAGSAYFDREISEEEVTVMSNVPDGHVIVGAETKVPSATPDK